MPIPNWYKAHDRARWTLDSAISAAAVTANITLDAQAITNWWGFPAAPSIITFFEINPATWEEIQVEQCEVTNIVPVGASATVTISRAFSDTTAYNRPAWSLFDFRVDQEYIQQIQDEVDSVITDLETDYLTIREYINGDYVYAESAVWTDDYAVTLPLPLTAYQDWQRVVMQIDVANNWPATLNVDWLWAIPLKKYHDQDLVTGDLEALSVVTAVYINWVFEITSQIANPSWWLEIPTLASSFELWEDFPNGWLDNEWAWFLWCGTAQIDNTWPFVSDFDIWSWWAAWQNTADFSIPYTVSNVLKEITVNLRKVWAPADDVDVIFKDIEDNYISTYVIPNASIWGTPTDIVIPVWRMWVASDKLKVQIARQWANDWANFYRSPRAVWAPIVELWSTVWPLNWLTYFQYSQTFVFKNECDAVLDWDFLTYSSSNWQGSREVRLNDELLFSATVTNNQFNPINYIHHLWWVLPWDVLTIAVKKSVWWPPRNHAADINTLWWDTDVGYYLTSRWFETDKVYLWDWRSEETSNIIWIAQEVWTTWQVKKFRISWLIPNTTNTPCDKLVLWQDWQYSPSENLAYSVNIWEQIDSSQVKLRYDTNVDDSYNVNLYLSDQSMYWSYDFYHWLWQVPSNVEVVLNLYTQDARSSRSLSQWRYNTWVALPFSLSAWIRWPQDWAEKQYCYSKVYSNARSWPVTNPNFWGTNTFNIVPRFIGIVDDVNTTPNPDLHNWTKAYITAVDAQKITVVFEQVNIPLWDNRVFNPLYFYLRADK